MKIKKTLKMSLLIILICIIALLIPVFAFFSFSPQIGAKATGQRLIRIKNSPNFKDSKFQNPIETPMSVANISTLKGAWKFFMGRENRMPVKPIPTNGFSKSRLLQFASDEPIITWLGHSTMLIEFAGSVFITDPVFSERASAVSFFGPKRFEYENQIPLNDLPKIDAVIISHDHYDHLDYNAIQQLSEKVDKYFVPLGVASHLEKWSVPAKKIVELDWFEEGNFKDKFKLTAAPARHFSGRGLTDRFATLWCSWILQTPKHKIFFGGDSGYFPGFKEIGEKYGPFDITMLECGAYSIYWPTIHMMPEETIQAHIDLRGSVLMPIHWSKFNLSIHSWIEPIERLSKKAYQENIKLATPIIGESFNFTKNPPSSKWWKTKG